MESAAAWDGNGTGAATVGGRMELATALDFVRDHRHGVLTTIKADGRPQLSNITYAIDTDDAIRISVTASRAKSRNMARDPRVSLHVTRDDFYAYVVVEGDADLTPPAATTDDDTVEQLVMHYRAIVGEHADWDDYRRAMVAEARLVATLRPTRAYGMLSLPT